jgi:hypothetical protein
MQIKSRRVLALGFLALSISGCGAAAEGEEGVDEQAGALATTIASAVNCGGPKVGGILINGNMTVTFAADQGFTGGSTINHPEVAIDTTKVSRSYPPAVFQSARVGNAGFSYTFGPYAPNALANVNLLFAETYFKTTNSRQFNVSINGATVLASFDIVQASGGKGIAIEKTFTTTTDATGFVKIQFSPIAGKNQPLVSGMLVSPRPTMSM